MQSTAVAADTPDLSDDLRLTMPPPAGSEPKRGRGRPPKAATVRAAAAPEDRSLAVKALIPVGAMLCKTVSLVAASLTRAITHDADCATLAKFTDDENAALAPQIAAVLAKYPESATRYMEESMLGASLIGVIGGKVVAIKAALAAKALPPAGAESTTH